MKGFKWENGDQDFCDEAMDAVKGTFDHNFQEKIRVMSDRLENNVRKQIERASTKAVSETFKEMYIGVSDDGASIVVYSFTFLDVQPKRSFHLEDLIEGREETWRTFHELLGKLLEI